jgi:hypothetical protein
MTGKAFSSTGARVFRQQAKSLNGMQVEKNPPLHPNL